MSRRTCDLCGKEADIWKDKIYKVPYQDKVIYIDSRGNCLNDEQDLKQCLETIRNYVKYIVRYACDYYYQFISIKSVDGFSYVSATNFRDCSENCYQMYAPLLSKSENAINETTAKAIVIVLKNAKRYDKSLAELANFCKETLREVKEEEEQEMLEALRESIKESSKSMRKRKIIKEIIEFYGEKEVAERLLRRYKQTFCGKPYKICYRKLTDDIVWGFKEICNLFPEWYEKCYVPAHMNRQWREIAKKEISEESLLQSISYFFIHLVKEVRE